MSITDELKGEIEQAAAKLGIAPSTVGQRAGQGGRFYARLCSGKRVWPETAESVRAKLSQMLSPESEARVSCLSPKGEHSVSENQEAAGQEIPTGAST